MLMLGASALPFEAYAGDMPLVGFTPQKGAFAVVERGVAAPIIHDGADAAVVSHAAQDLASDIALVTGVKPIVADHVAGQAPRAIIIGTLGHSALVDRIVAERHIDIAKLKGAWESYLILPVAHPVAGVDQALLVIGSDRRGTAFGAFELSQAAGVSPFVWWADVAPAHHDALYVPAGARRFGPPSVQYRGIFINDEDWGMFPWAAKTFDPATGNIGPKTYRRVYELLLRLRANTLWPAMHKTTVPFNNDPENARLADEYGIVMGSSHAEPMLRNNLGEWKDKAEAFNYATNPAGVHAYWEERVRSNARYESLWTLGMRGIHDSSMVGATTNAEKIDLLHKIFADQRALLKAHVDPKVSGAQQVFVPYKEVLDIYRNGLKVPEDVTIVWPDDNYGYIRQFPNAAERARSGGTGIYYHLSYLGTPRAYLWLETTPPALVMQEMTRAYDNGAQKMWIANVGDIKPAEIGLSLFMEMGWDIDRWRGKAQGAFLKEWSTRTFGSDQGAAIGGLLDQYYRINFEVKPEFVGWPAISSFPRNTVLSPRQIDARLAWFDQLSATSKAIAAKVSPAQGDAYFELVDYPVRASAAMNFRTYAADRYDELIDVNPTMARSAGAVAGLADAELTALTARFNNEVAGGKWRHIMAVEPADSQWRIFRTNPVAVPSEGLRGDPALFMASIRKPAHAPTGPHALGEGAERFAEAIKAVPFADANQIIEAEDAVADKGWTFVDGLGRGRGAMMAQKEGATLTFSLSAAGDAGLTVGLLPLYPTQTGGALVFGVCVDGGAEEVVNVPRSADSGHVAAVTGGYTWAQGVLDNLLTVPTGVKIGAGAHSIRIRAISDGVAVDRIVLAR